MRQILLLTLTVLLLPWKALATSINLPPWEQLATTSEFIGTVECITAGGIVARYRVIDSWKGAAVGTEMNISQHADVCGPQFPISLVGERFLVFGEMTAFYRIHSFDSAGQVPLWWRELPADFRCFRLIPIKEPFGSYLSASFRVRAGRLDDFKTAVTGFLGCGKEEQERRLMLAAFRECLQLPDPNEPSSKGNEKDVKLYDALQKTKSVEELWKRMIAPPQTAEGPRPGRHEDSLLMMLISGGREQCRDLLEKADFSKLPWEKKSLNEALSAIRGNLAADRAQPIRHKPHADGQKPPTPDDIAKAETLLSKPWDYETGSAFEMLCRHSPGYVVPFLLGWGPSKEGRDQHFGYLLGSAFGHLCAADRAKHLKALQSAKDNWIRVSAAVYLRFDERSEGEDALRKMAMIEGDPGAWAALVLASRGDKAAMVRALDIFATPRQGGGMGAMESMNHGNLQDRLRVLLSNAAGASGIPQPPASPKNDSERSDQLAAHRQWHEAMINWWNENQEKIFLEDPWAKHLEAQKVD